MPQKSFMLVVNHLALVHNKPMHFATTSILCIFATALCTTVSGENDPPVVLDLMPSSPSTRVNVAIPPVSTIIPPLLIRPSSLTQGSAVFIGQSSSIELWNMYRLFWSMEAGQESLYKKNQSKVSVHITSKNISNRDWFWPYFAVYWKRVYRSRKCEGRG